MIGKCTRILLSGVLLFWTLYLVNAQDMTDEGLKKWVSQFSSLHLLTTNDDASYATVTKSYMGNVDTVLVFSHKRKNPIDTLVGYTISRSFVTNNHLFAVGVNQARLVNVSTGQKLDYNSVRNAGVIKGKGQYYIVDRKKMLTVYDLEGDVLYRADGVDKVVGDEHKMVLVKGSSDGISLIVVWDGQKGDIIYSTGLSIDKIELLPSGRYLSIRETEVKSDTRSMKILDCLTRKVIAPLEIQNIPERVVKVTEVENGKSFLITAEIQIPVSDTPMVKLWYGTDKELRFTKNGKTKYRFWFLTDGFEKVEELPTDRFEVFTPLNNSRYLWAFSNREEFDYVHANPRYNMFLYDTELKTYTLIYPQVAEIFGSADGRYAVSLDGKEKIWKLFDLQDQKMIDIEGTDLRNPVFSLDGRKLFFSGETDLYCFDLKTGVLKSLDISKDSEVVVIDKKVIMGFTHLETKFNTFTVDTAKPVRLQLYNSVKSVTSVLEWKRNKAMVLVPETDRRIRKIIFGGNGKNKWGFSIEENFNLPDGLYYIAGSGKKKKLLYQTNPQDTAASKLKVEVVHYRNSLGVLLKGILTYPVNYDSGRKYPMVVRVYQRQSSASSHYISADVGQDGFSKRLLIEKGYFVFQPDIVFDHRGTGVSSLDCVNKALGALEAHSSIDFSKVGLMGHSMGGYETNFIATQSKRFAAYISGSSVANTVQAYFSYNRLFEVPDYARYEYGQFDMNVPYSENRELYDQNNPVNYVQNVNAPVLLWAGSKDTNVVPEQTEAFYVGLLRNRKSVIALHYRDQSHSLGFMTPETFDLNRRVMEWWDFFLKGKKDVEWIRKEMISY
ncbi:Prolyl oligopeptidase family protein [Chryseobacterium arachidis]|uniref:Prolyl oligopeptidase family protein n=3 Tax=Chryseobacterium arachidis TaxID=1416778 RepID=A0A1M5C4R0_9FLAO|nr:Prolyl oligopeptidase family protein [Chryseobacterium arachidis]